MKPILPMAIAASGATLLMVASVAMEAGGVKKSPRARAAVGAAVRLFIPMAIPCPGFIGCDSLDRKQRTRKPGEAKAPVSPRRASNGLIVTGEAGSRCATSRTARPWTDVVVARL